MASSIKKSKVKLDLLTDIYMLLMVGKGSGVAYFMLFIDMEKLITNTSKIMIKENWYIDY